MARARAPAGTNLRDELLSTQQVLLHFIIPPHMSPNASESTIPYILPLPAVSSNSYLIFMRVPDATSPSKHRLHIHHRVPFSTGKAYNLRIPSGRAINTTRHLGCPSANGIAHLASGWTYPIRTSAIELSLIHQPLPRRVWRGNCRSTLIVRGKSERSHNTPCMLTIL